MTATFPLNAWYAAAWDVEVKRALLPRTICGQKLVLYRKEDGTPVALADACWHRLVPLSRGHLKGDEVVCAYHGLVFNPQGRCTHMPSQETINPSACVRACTSSRSYSRRVGALRMAMRSRGTLWATSTSRIHTGSVNMYNYGNAMQGSTGGVANRMGTRQGWAVDMGSGDSAPVHKDSALPVRLVRPYP